MHFVRLLFLSLFILTLGCSTLTEPGSTVQILPPSYPLDPVAQSIKSTGVLLRKKGADVWAGTACAIEYIGPGRLITAHHCVMASGFTASEYNPGTATSIPSPDGKIVKWVKFDSVYDHKNVKGEQFSGKVIASDYDNDVALVLALDTAGQSDSWVTVRGEDPRLDEPVFAMGHPMGLWYTLSRGYVSFPLRDLDGSKYIQVDIHVYYGNSGGGLYDEHGMLIGVCSAFYEAPHLALFVHPVAIRALMNKVNWN